MIAENSASLSASDATAHICASRLHGVANGSGIRPAASLSAIANAAPNLTKRVLSPNPSVYATMSVRFRPSSIFDFLHSATVHAAPQIAKRMGFEIASDSRLSCWRTNHAPRFRAHVGCGFAAAVTNASGRFLLKATAGGFGSRLFC